MKRFVQINIIAGLAALLCFSGCAKKTAVAPEAVEIFSRGTQVESVIDGTPGQVLWYSEHPIQYGVRFRSADRGFVTVTMYAFEIRRRRFYISD